ncbi:hypothetical protein QMZ65_06025 [Pantoea sp. EABMAA-21]|jgi:hypothetical protein|uniref:MrpH family fimbial adhesin n=1 Tax=unclassified Pantoea TaxID=2630326 RepID=UPI000BDB5799|nr:MULTISPECIES: hypothetical protein [unclassified Pantoea]MDI9276766.1 hypothetical protein [Pantoea sp. EABMAA-21]SNY66130.1 hypothetical protein SAMN02744778_02124 [Pantoea sp. GL120224-02]
MKVSYVFILLFLSLISLSAKAVISITRAEIPAGSSRIEISYSASGGNATSHIGCGVRYCGFGIWVVNSSGATATTRYALHSGSGGMPATDTWSNANITFLRNYPASASFTASLPLGSPPYSICVGGGTNALGANYRNQPGTSCRTVSLPPVPTSCSFSGSPNINHGSLQADKVNGKQDSVSINVYCNRATSATIGSLGGTINLGGGVTSTLTFDGRSSGSIYLSSGNSTHTVSSTLRATNPTPGDKSGSGTIVINLP